MTHPAESPRATFPSLQEAQAQDPSLIPNSFTTQGGAALWLSRRGEKKHLVVALAAHDGRLGFLDGERFGAWDDHEGKLCPLTPANAGVLRDLLPHLSPVALGLTTSAGFGDRLGVATPGHALALKRAGGEIAPIFAQQSIREMTRTKRAPREVMDDATWGAFEAGWRGLLGADADHQKTIQDLDECAAAGFTLFTIDPGEHVDDAAHDAPLSDLEAKVDALPWDDLETTRADFERYVGKTLDLGERNLTLEREGVLRAAAKYGRAVAHALKMYRHLEAKGIPFELEVSVDETETPTSHAEHAVVALELSRLGVRWVGLAPRFVGRFEKGVDYRGDLSALREDLLGHAALARALGPYKLSLHSGSDKFSVYPLFMEVTNGLVHVKTAGTSYLEALRVTAQVNPALFREVAALAYERFAEDRASYHVSAELARVPELETLSDAELPELLNQDDARQVLHVTFGSALDHHKEALLLTLATHETAHYDGLSRHFERHLKPFVKSS